MSVASTDSIRKHIVRERWNTPILKHVNKVFRNKYLYCGLPAADALDIKLWREMIRRVIAFEIEDENDSKNPRKDIIKLKTNLALLNIPHTVYCGFFENTILQELDNDGQPYTQNNELVTLYNLDFCNSISGKIETKDGSRQLRFAAIRTLLQIQEEICSPTGQMYFIILLTIRDELHKTVMNNFISHEEKSADMVTFLRDIPLPEDKGYGMVSGGMYLKAYIFHTIRSYCRARNIKTYFLPPVKYIGRSERSNMVHYTIFCRSDKIEQDLPLEIQTTNIYMRTKSWRALDDNLIIEPSGEWEDHSPVRTPIEVAESFFRTK